MASIFVFHLWLIAAIALSFLLLSSADVRKLCVSEGRARTQSPSNSGGGSGGRIGNPR